MQSVMTLSKKSSLVREESPNKLKNWFRRRKNGTTSNSVAEAPASSNLNHSIPSTSSSFGDKPIGAIYVKSEVQKRPQAIDNINIALQFENDLTRDNNLNLQLNTGGECSKYLDENKNVVSVESDGNWVKKYYNPTLELLRKPKPPAPEIPEAQAVNTKFWPIVFNKKLKKRTVEPPTRQLTSLQRASLHPNNKNARKVSGKILFPTTNDLENNRKKCDDNLKISKFFGLDEFGGICIHHDIVIVSGREAEDISFACVLWHFLRVEEVTEEVRYEDSKFSFKKFWKFLFGRKKREDDVCGEAFELEENYDVEEGDDGNYCRFFCFVVLKFYMNFYFSTRVLKKFE